jgi:hypothetical protein
MSSDLSSHKYKNDKPHLKSARNGNHSSATPKKPLRTAMRQEMDDLGDPNLRDGLQK